MMKLLMDTGKVFKESTHVAHSWNVLNVPHYLPAHFEAEIAVDHKHCGDALNELLNYAVNITVNSVVEVSDTIYHTTYNTLRTGFAAG